MNAPAIIPAAEKPKPMDSADVRACIHRHFGANGDRYAILHEVRNGTAWKANRSVDTVVMGLWPSLGMELWGMEIKVSKWDWRRELKDPDKASEVFGYFDRWFLVCPEGIAEMSELPQPWGWFVAEPGGGLRKMRDAEKNQTVKPVDRHFLGGLLRNVGREDDAALDARVRSLAEAQRRGHEKEVEHRVLEKLGDMRKAAEGWVKVRDLLKGKPEDYIHQPEVIEALRVIIKSGIAKSYHGLTSLLENTGRMHAELSKIAQDLRIPTTSKEAERRARKAGDE